MFKDVLRMLDPKPAVCLRCHKRFRTLLQTDDHVEQECGHGNNLDLAYLAPRPLERPLPTVRGYNHPGKRVF